MLKIGLTGGIGVGKTTVSDIFKNMGVPVIDTDIIARELVCPGSPVLTEIVDTFGTEILTQDNKLDRRLLGKIVFSDSSLRKSLESILHPRIKNAVLKRLQDLNAPYCIVVVPLLFETDFVELVDKVLVIDAPEEQRIGWIEKRNGLSKADISAIVSTQTTRQTRLASADYVIVNNGTIKDLEGRVLTAHRSILATCGETED